MDEKYGFPNTIFLGILYHVLILLASALARKRAFFMQTDNTERKKSFIMYMSHRAMFEVTTPEQCQELMIRIFDFAETGVPADDISDPLIKICYDQITFLMAENMRKYEAKCQKISEAKSEYWKEQREVKRLAEKIKKADGNQAEQLEAVRQYEEHSRKLKEIEEDATFNEDDVPFK